MNMRDAPVKISRFENESDRIIPYQAELIRIEVIFHILYVRVHRTHHPPFS
jgi:hypothetical protein